MNNNIKKFLVSAYGCEPDKGSESGIGWQWSLQLARFGEVYVITRSNNKDNIDKGLKLIEKKVANRLHFYYYDTSDYIKKIKNGDKNLYIYYFCWQIGAYKLAKKICQNLQFDYCFALTFGSIWMPTFMYKLNIPFIWGPIGGGESIPDNYIPLIGRKASIPQKIRKLMIKTISFNPLVIMPIRNSKFIISRTNDTKNIIPKKYSDKVQVCLETSIDLSEIKAKDYNQLSNSKIKFIYSGRLIKIKGIDLVIRAIAECKNKDKIEFILIGDGNQKDELRELARSLNIEEKVIFIGKKTRNDLLSILKQGDVFIFPSFKEGGSWSLMEGMGSALPIICLDTSGMHVITDEHSAIRIPIGDIDITINQYVKAIDKLASNADLRKTMGLSARKRIEKVYNWNAKGDFLRNLILND